MDQNQAVYEIADPETRNETPLPSQADPQLRDIASETIILI